MFYECTVAVLQAEILQKNEQKEQWVELLKLKKKKKVSLGLGCLVFFFRRDRSNTTIHMDKIYYNAGIFSFGYGVHFITQSLWLSFETR